MQSTRDRVRMATALKKTGHEKTSITRVSQPSSDALISRRHSGLIFGGRNPDRGRRATLGTLPAHQEAQPHSRYYSSGERSSLPWTSSDHGANASGDLSSGTGGGDCWGGSPKPSRMASPSGELLSVEADRRPIPPRETGEITIGRSSERASGSLTVSTQQTALIPRPLAPGAVQGSCHDVG